MSLTAEHLRRILFYDPSTGEFTRIRSRIRWVGKPAGSIHKGHGYVVIKIRQATYLAHRLAWLYVYGEWPTKDIDHRNGIRHDNRIQNLREAEPVENAANRRIHRCNRSGFKGVTFKPNQPGRPWQAHIMRRGRQFYLGSYASPEEAALAYAVASREYHGEFARTE